MGKDFFKHFDIFILLLQAVISLYKTLLELFQGFGNFFKILWTICWS